jgi:hypothetical protein
MLGIGLKIILTRKPVVLLARWLLAFMALTFTPMLIKPICDLFKYGFSAISLAPMIVLVMYSVLLVMIWFVTKGYLILGVAEDTFRDALHYALNKLNIKFEETLSRIKLPDRNCELQVAIQAWVGTAQIKLKESKDRALLKNIVKEVNNYFQSNSETKTNYLIAIFYSILGLLMIIFMIAMLILF